MMEFRAPTVQKKKNPKARISVLGAVLLVGAIFLALVDGYEDYATWTFAIAVIIFFVGAVLAKGDLTDVAVSQVIQLEVSSSGVRIGNDLFKMSQMKNINFDIKGYAGMPGATNYLPADADSNGMGNYLRFGYLGEQVACRFFLYGPQHMQQLGILFKTFYKQRIPFVERIGLYQTFLFQPMSEKELKENLLKFLA
jgi:hypothetical protein